MRASPSASPDSPFRGRSPAREDQSALEAGDSEPAQATTVGIADNVPAAPPPPSAYASREYEEWAKGELFADMAGVIWRRSHKLLGRGAFGNVYLGMRQGDGKLVALKYLDIPSVEATDRANHRSPRMRRVGQQAEERLGGLMSEVRALSSLRHTNIVACFGFAVVDNSLVLALEYVSGGSLQSLLDEFGAIPISVAQRHLTDVLRGLRYLHSQHTMHRDVKPGNVLLDVAGTCKLTDFGTSAKARRTGPGGAGAKGVVVGTPAYMAPEQARGMDSTTPNSDLWSIGIMALQMLTGQLPFDMGAPFAADRHIYRLAFDPEFDVPIPSHITGDARDFIERCLRREASERGSAEELLLHPFLAVPHKGKQAGNAAVESGPLMSPRRRGSHWSSARRRRSVSFPSQQPSDGATPSDAPTPIATRAGVMSPADSKPSRRLDPGESTPHPRATFGGGNRSQRASSVAAVALPEELEADASTGVDDVADSATTATGTVASPDPQSPVEPERRMMPGLGHGSGSGGASPAASSSSRSPNAPTRSRRT